jgi:hypothetical protein
LVGPLFEMRKSCARWKMGQTVRSRNDEPLTAAFDNKPATLTNCDDSALRSIVIHGRHPSAPRAA